MSKNRIARWLVVFGAQEFITILDYKAEKASLSLPARILSIPCVNSGEYKGKD